LPNFDSALTGYAPFACTDSLMVSHREFEFYLSLKRPLIDMELLLPFLNDKAFPLVKWIARSPPMPYLMV